MIREFIASANTVDEAITLACEELGIPVDECSPEILQLPKKSLFGKIKQQAKVRVTVESPDAPIRREEPKKEPKPFIHRQPPVQPKPEPKIEKPIAPKPSAPIIKEEIKAEPTPPSTTEPMDVTPKIEVAKTYLMEIFTKMGVAEITAEFKEVESRTVIVHLSGKDIGTVIGKRGETLDAIQYLVCLVANRLEGDYVRFTMNAGNYREKREETLRALAQRMARKVIKSGRPAALEPMNPYERRIIHAVITDIEGVFSKSTGEEPNRKVVIKPVFKQGGSTFRRDDRPRGSRPPRPGTRPTTAPVGTPIVAEKPLEAPIEKKPEKKLDDTVKLYSKIELD